MKLIRVFEDLTAVPDEDVPQNLVDLDNEDEQVPLANTDLGKQERPGTRMSYLPIYVGIGSAAVLGLILSALYLNKRRKASVKSEMISDDIGNDE